MTNGGPKKTPPPDAPSIPSGLPEDHKAVQEVRALIQEYTRLKNHQLQFIHQIFELSHILGDAKEIYNEAAIMLRESLSAPARFKIEIQALDSIQSRQPLNLSVGPEQHTEPVAECEMQLTLFGLQEYLGKIMIFSSKDKAGAPLTDFDRINLETVAKVLSSTFESHEYRKAEMQKHRIPELNQAMAVISVDLDKNVSFFNPNPKSEILQEAIGLKLNESIPSLLEPYVEEVIKTNQPKSFSKILENGKQFVFNIIPDTDENRLNRILIFALDSTERTPQLNPNPVLKITPNNEVHYLNSSASSLFAYFNHRLGKSPSIDAMIQKTRETQSPQVLRSKKYFFDFAYDKEEGIVNVFAIDLDRLNP